MSESYEMKKKIYLEKRRQREKMNVSTIQRAQQRIKTREQQNDKPVDAEKSLEPLKKSSIKDFYKMGNFYTKKSRSVVDHRV